MSLGTVLWQVCPALSGEAGGELGHWSLDVWLPGLTRAGGKSQGLNGAGLGKSRGSEPGNGANLALGLDQGEEMQEGPH